MEYFNFDEPLITLFSFHPQIRTILAINGLFFNNKTSKLRFIWPFLCVSLGGVGGYIELMVMLHALSEDDIALFTEAVAYWVIIMVVPVLYVSVFKGATKIYQLVDKLDYDFRFVCAQGDPFRTIFLEGQRNICKFGIVWMAFVSLVGNMYIIFSIVQIIVYCLFATQSEESARPYMFPVYLPNVNTNETPTYEMLMFVSYFAVINIYSTFTTYVYIVFHLLLHCYYIIEMIILALNSLFDGVEEEVAYLEKSDERYIKTKSLFGRRIKRIVDWHNGVFNIIDATLAVYGPAIAYQVIFSAVVMCLMAFNISLQLEEGKFDILILLLGIGATVQLWIPCYIGSLLLEKGFSIGETCYCSGWHKSALADLVRTDMLLIIRRSQKPITIAVTCLPPLQMETFSSITSTAYSYFNMLRQTGK